MIEDLSHDSLEIFRRTIAAVNARQAVERTVSCDASRLSLVDTVIPLEEVSHIYSVAVGKAAMQMARGLESKLGARFSGGVLSGIPDDVRLASGWQIFAGGHPLPNRDSIGAARAAIELLRRADHPRSLIIFLISGGGSAMFESPSDASVTLDDLRATNEVLVNCGAHIAEVNAVRRTLSAVKGGKLAGVATLARHVTLIVSDVSAGDDAADSVASGLTRTPTVLLDAQAIIARYKISAHLPASVLRLISAPNQKRQSLEQTGTPRPIATRGFHVLLDNDAALEAAARCARELGYDVEIARDITDQDVETGSRMLVERLLTRANGLGDASRKVCVVSGGEFSCPVRGAGIGGRNTETALRCAMNFARLRSSFDGINAEAIALCSGTDGVDGNSPATGAIADPETLRRAREIGLDHADFLSRSDTYNFFRRLGDLIVTGATGTNVRDMRVLLSAIKN